MTTPAQKYICQTNHHDPHWPVISQDLRTIPTSKYTVFTPTEKSTTSVVLAIYRYFADTALKYISHFTQKACNKDKEGNPSYSAHLVPIDPVIKSVLEEFQPAAFDKLELSQKGVSREDYEKCLERATEIFQGFFKRTGNPKFPVAWDSSDFDKWVIRTKNELIFEVFESLDFEKSPGPIEYTQEQLRTFMIDKNKKVEKASDLSCFAYALLLAGETEARNIIFSKYSVKDPLEVFQAWNWRPVDAPCEGDIVVYLKDNGEPVHFGYFGEDGLVHSKFGNGCPYSYKHRLFDVPAEYNDKVIFLRKSKSPLFDPKELFLEALATGNTFSQNAGFICVGLDKLEKKNAKKSAKKK